MSDQNYRDEEKIKVRLALDPDAAAILIELAGSPRKQGEYVSNLLRAAAATEAQRAQVEQADLPTLRQMMQIVLTELALLKKDAGKQ